MGLYQLKEFLTLDDVADYLRDKGVYDFDLSQSIDSCRMHDLLKEWAFGNKLSLVFSYYGRIDVYNKTFNEDTRNPIEKINLFTHNQNVVLVFNDSLLKQWANGWHLRHKFFDENVHKYTWQVPVYQLFEYNYSLLDDKDHPFIILLDDCNGEYGIEPLFPKSQLDKILNAKDDSQKQIADLQAENARLQARIAEFESQLNQARENGTPAFMNHTEEIAIIGAVYDEFWANLAPNEIPPKKDTVLDWITKNYKISNNIASAIDTICRPPEPRKGGQKSR